MKASQAAQRKVYLPVFVNVFAFDSLRQHVLVRHPSLELLVVRKMEKGPPPPQNVGFSREMGLQS